MKTKVLFVRHAECVGNVLKDEYVKGNGPKPDHLPEYRNSKVTKRGRVQGYLGGVALLEAGVVPARYYVSLLDRPTETALAMSELVGLRSGQPVICSLCCLNELGKSPVVRLAQRFKDMLASGVRLNEEDERLAKMMLLAYFLFFMLLHHRYGDIRSDECATDGTSSYGADAFLAYTVRYPEFGNLISSFFPLFSSSGVMRKEDEEYIVHIWHWLQKERRKPRPSDVPMIRDADLAIICDDGEELFLTLDTGTLEVAMNYRKAPTRSPRGMLEKAFLEHEDCRPIVVITHAKRLIRLRQELEGFDEGEYCRLVKLDGLNFPQNLSMTHYEYENGVWTLIGEPYVLPRGLIVVSGTRRLGFDLRRQDFETICGKLGFDPKEVEDPLLDKLS